jgi:glycine betaine/proline transport system substrate-binding protein
MAVPAPAGESTSPGEGKEIRMGRATWNTGWFQAEVYSQLLEKLGYTVSKPVTVDNAAFYQAVGQGSIDMWVNGWFPNHNSYKDSYEEGARAIGYVAKGGALQGYLIDKATHEEYGIDNLADLKKPSVRKLFDEDGDGRAEMVACPPGWACEEIISHHLDAYGLGEHVEPVKAGYAAAMANALGRYKDGKPIFFYTWTPNWTVGELKPGEDVVWLEVPEPNLPESQKDLEDATTVSGVTGCVDDPCEMGWPANDLRPVANDDFLDANPAVETLLKVAGIPVADIFAQNAKMHAGENSASDIERHARTWIDNHPGKVDRWLTKARKAAAM